MTSVKTVLKSYRVEVIWLVALVVGAIVIPNALPVAQAETLAVCYYDPFFNWCFDNHLPLDCLCDY
ncbi:MAG: hypothetical protein IT178_12495 [Acidobacteria bacterium]|nr:hypothetical protein [Acidobacteriota bacterium]